MAVDISGFDLEVRATGIIHSSGERVLFTLENEGDPKDPVLRFFSHIANPQAESTSDFLYFCARNSPQRISFVWGADAQKPLTWSGRLSIPKETAD